MSQEWHQWLEKRPPVPGVVACGIGFPDKTCVARSFAPKFPLETLKNAWRCLLDAFEVVNLHRFPADEFRWQFENATVYSVRRADQVFLGMFLEKDPLAVDWDAARNLAAEFLKAPLEPPAAPSRTLTPPPAPRPPAG